MERLYAVINKQYEIRRVFRTEYEAVAYINILNLPASVMVIKG